jgi:hypothetical protein
MPRSLLEGLANDVLVRPPGRRNTRQLAVADDRRQGLDSSERLLS